MDKFRVMTNGDCGLEVVFGDEIDKAINKKVHGFAAAIRELNVSGILDVVPTYTSVLIDYLPLLVSYDQVLTYIKEARVQVESLEEDGYEVIHIPVYYGGDTGPDIAYVADFNGLSVEEVIDKHASVLYRVYMLGFKPGFPYLGGMSESIETPRLETPRVKVRAGSIGIAGKQTGVYPQESPGGWQIIGHTPVQFIDWNSEELALLKPGQYVKFNKVDYTTYCAIKEAVDNHTYKPRIESYKERTYDFD